MGNECELQNNERDVIGDAQLEETIKNMRQGREIKLPVDDAITHIRAGYSRSMAVTDKNEVYVWGEDFHGFRTKNPELLFQSESLIEDIAFGKMHGLYSDNEGQIYTWGEGTYGETANAAI